MNRAPAGGGVALPGAYGRGANCHELQASLVRRAGTHAHGASVNLAISISCLYCPKGKVVEGSKRTKHILAALLHSRCPKLLAQESRALVYPPFAGPLGVGDAGIEPATSAV
jgi:hypothetical protein